uniref:Uncharacterized protein n=1 Tax=Plectus sambesii TaxID=2011161 RepID=A0A914VJR1_9BILA
MALYHGAAKVITAEYAPLTIEHPQIAYVHPIELVKNWEKYAGVDFIASFSSIEHSGLARYGDPPDPIGDLREMSKIFCLLKQGGLFNKVHSVSVYGEGYTSFQASIGGSGKVYGIVAVPDKCHGTDTECANNNGGCPYLCLPKAAGGVSCVCPENVKDLDGCEGSL